MTRHPTAGYGENLGIPLVNRHAYDGTADSISSATTARAQEQRGHQEATSDLPTRRKPLKDVSRDLSPFDVAALIINKMIGTGIFTAPFTVLINSKSKSIAIGLWICGFLYTVLSMFMYLEYARKLPFTGGELVYLDDLMPKYPLWLYTLYAFYFVIVYTTAPNALQFSAQVLLASEGRLTLDNTVDQRLLRFLAVVVTTAICLLLYFSKTKSRLLNRLSAFLKVSLLFVVLGFGVAYLVKKESHWDGWLESSRSDTAGPQWQIALLTILFTFHGWENATLVAGEIPSFSVLRWGFILGVSIVGLLYLLIAIVTCAAVNNDNAAPLKNYVAAFFSIATKAGPDAPSKAVAVAAAVLIAISAVGSMISVAYTCVRVKQSIGWTNILPLSRIWKRSGPLRPTYEKVPQREVGDIDVTLTFGDESPYTYPGTPEGGIILHWVMTVVFICLTAAFDLIREGMSFTGDLLVYGHFFIEGIVGIGFITFNPTPRQDVPTGYPAKDWFPDHGDGIRPQAWWTRKTPFEYSLASLGDGVLQTILGIALCIFSVVIVVLECFRQQGRIYLYVTGGILLFAWGYWWLFLREESSWIYGLWRTNAKVQVLKHGHDDQEKPSHLCPYCEDFNAIPGSTDHRHSHHSFHTYISVTNPHRGVDRNPIARE